MLASLWPRLADRNPLLYVYAEEQAEIEDTLAPLAEANLTVRLRRLGLIHLRGKMI
jgi:hypothetical protein